MKIIWRYREHAVHISTIDYDIDPKNGTNLVGRWTHNNHRLFVTYRAPFVYSLEKVTMKYREYRKVKSKAKQERYMTNGNFPGCRYDGPTCKSTDMLFFWDIYIYIYDTYNKLKYIYADMTYKRIHWHIDIGDFLCMLFNVQPDIIIIYIYYSYCIFSANWGIEIIQRNAQCTTRYIHTVLALRCFTWPCIAQIYI